VELKGEIIDLQHRVAVLERQAGITPRKRIPLVTTERPSRLHEAKGQQPCKKLG
jgi:hypothetical protein